MQDFVLAYIRNSAISAIAGLLIFLKGKLLLMQARYIRDFEL